MKIIFKWNLKLKNKSSHVGAVIFAPTFAVDCHRVDLNPASGKALCSCFSKHDSRRWTRRTLSDA